MSLLIIPIVGLLIYYIVKRTDLTNSAFFYRMSPIDLRVRGVASEAEYRAKYSDAISHLTDDESAIILRHGKKLPLVVTYYGYTIHLTPLTSASCLKLADGIENNWPHTLEDKIMLPCFFIARNATDERLMCRVLLHEQIHVWQRANRPTMLKIMAALGCVRVKKPYLMCNNPDIDDDAYAYGDSLSVLSYNNADVISMQETGVKSYYGSKLIDHPYERMAHEISMQYF